MPPRYAYWTILAGGLPTAFRAAEKDDLLPTFHRLREKHPDAEMKWFARGRLWESPEQAREDRERRPERGTRQDMRGADWRPGGTHRDPRQKFKDAKKARNVDRRRDRFQRKHAGGPIEKPHGDALLHPPGREKRPKTDRPRSTMTRATSTHSHSRPFRPRDKYVRNQNPGEPAAPSRPSRPNREPRPGEKQEPTPPPRPSEPTIRPPGPPERGRRRKS